jgi:DNA-binding NarL/FixJ family response regulator
MRGCKSDSDGDLNMPVFESLDRKPSAVADHKFSTREIEIIRLLAQGLSAKCISMKLFISEDTVKTHRKNIRAKSGCKNTLELFAKSTSEGWI